MHICIYSSFFLYAVPPSLLPSNDRVVTNVFSEKVMLICVAFGLPAPNITWFDAENKEIFDSDRAMINTTQNIDVTSLIKVTSTLEILYPQNVDGGLYQCIADNGLSLASNRIILVVLGNKFINIRAYVPIAMYVILQSIIYIRTYVYVCTFICTLLTLQKL